MQRQHAVVTTRRAALFLLLVGLTPACPEEMESPTPSLTGASPAIVCNDQLTTTVALGGAGLSPVVVDSLTGDAALRLPDLRLTRTQELDGTAAATPTEVDLDELSGIRWLNQGLMELDVTPSLVLTPGIYDVTAENADGSFSTLAAGLVIVPPPVLDAVVPTPVCTEQFENIIELTGSGFLEIEGRLPSVSIGDLVIAADAVGDCFELGGPTEAQSCNTITVTLAEDALPPGSYAVVVTNPAPANCESTATVTLEVVPPPTVTDVIPETICSSGSEFQVLGEDFREGARVFVGETEAVDVTFVDSGRLDVRTGSGVAPGIHTVTVRNADGCEDTLESAVEVVPGPILFFVDPPVVYQGITVRVSLLVAGISGEILSVGLIEEATDTETPLDFEYAPDDDPNVILADVPAGLPEGSYHVFVAEDSGCTPLLENALFVEADLTLDIAEVRPPFAWTDEDTAVDILADSDIFEEIPRVYLNPDEPADDTVATALASVTFVSGSRLTAIVPEGLTVDVYDVIVVNPSGEIGLAEAAVEVVADPPPLIDSVSPTRALRNTTTEITFQGENFRSPSVVLTCRAVGDGGVLSSTTDEVDLTVSGNATTVQGTLTAGAVGEDSVCIVRITNDDGTFFDYSAFSVGSPSGNLFGFNPGPDMETARRAPAAVAGRATATARYLYAIGGDDGADAVHATIEVAALDAFGQIEGFSTLPVGIANAAGTPLPRTLAGVTILERFIYLVGGDDGENVVDTVLRAQVLDPRAAPRFDTLAFDFDTEAGLGGGTWIYRVSAVFPDDDPVNPGGESLASDPIVVRLPGDIVDVEGAPLLIPLTIAWTQVEAASGYRVYRTPVADAGSGTEELLAEVEGGTTLSFTDVGDETGEGAPLPPGSLGRWRSVATLASPLQGVAVTATADPDAADSWFIYIGGGHDGADPTDAIQRLTVTASGRDQSVAGPASVGTLSTARWQLGAFIVDRTFHTITCDTAEPPACEAWVYFGPGRGASSLSGVVDAAQVQADGSLTDADSDAFTPGAAGYGVGAASNFLYVFGGQGGTPANQSQEGALTEDDFPFPAFNNLGGSGIDTARFLMGSAQESAVMFVVGGETSGADASTSTELTNF